MEGHERGSEGGQEHGRGQPHRGMGGARVWHGAGVWESARAWGGGGTGGCRCLGRDSSTRAWQGEGPGKVQEPEGGHEHGRAGDITTGAWEGKEYSTGQAPGD